MLLISEGLGHAFVALSEHATVVYLCSAPYATENEHGVHSLDPPPVRASEPFGRARELDGRGIGDATRPSGNFIRRRVDQHAVGRRYGGDLLRELRRGCC